MQQLLHPADAWVERLEGDQIQRLTGSRYLSNDADVLLVVSVAPRCRSHSPWYAPTDLRACYSPNAKLSTISLGTLTEP